MTERYPMEDSDMKLETEDLKDTPKHPSVGIVSTSDANSSDASSCNGDRNGTHLYSYENVEKLKLSVDRINTDFIYLNRRYGYLADFPKDSNQNNGYKTVLGSKKWEVYASKYPMFYFLYRTSLYDKVTAFLCLVTLFFPMVLLWIAIFLLLLMMWMVPYPKLTQINANIPFVFLFFGLNAFNYSYSDYVLLKTNEVRLWLLTFDKQKQGAWWRAVDIVLQFFQTGLVVRDLLENKFDRTQLNMRRLFAGDGYPYSFKVELTRLEDYYELMQKKDLSDQDPTNSIYYDREGRVFGAAMNHPDLSKYFLPQCLSIADYRHRIGRDIAMLICWVDNKDKQFHNIPNFEKTVFKQDMSIPRQGSDDWLFKKYYKYPDCLRKNSKIIYHGTMFYRMFHIELTDTELQCIEGWIASIAFLAFPKSFHVIMGNQLLIKYAYYSVYTIANIIKLRCNDVIRERLVTYARNKGIIEDAVFFSAAIQWAFIGGSAAFYTAMQRFEEHPEREMHAFLNNRESYVMELIRWHAIVLGSTVSIAARPYMLRINGKKYRFPKGTPVGCPLICNSDTMPVFEPMQFRTDRKICDYERMITFHCVDGYFNPKSEVLQQDLQNPQMGPKRAGLNARFCPGRIVAPAHLAEIIELVFEEMQKSPVLKKTRSNYSLNSA